MKKHFKAIVIGLVLGVVAITNAHAKSELASISITPLWPTNAIPGNVVLYQVTVERSGQGVLEVAFNCTGLPQGCTASFSDAPVRFTGKNPRFLQFIMAITSDRPTPTDSYALTVTALPARETITVTNLLGAAARIIPEAPVLASLELRQGGGMELRGLGNTGQIYHIEATTDLANPTWTLAGDCTADGNGRFTFIDAGAQAQASSMRFYRAVKLAPANP